MILDGIQIIISNAPMRARAGIKYIDFSFLQPVS